MKSGYEIKWTDNALSELKDTYKYLEDNWTTKELNALSTDIEHTISLISNNPNVFPISDRTDVRRVVIKRFNTLYYREREGKRVEILSFFSNRQNPKKRKL
jgi:plasmid stabilization system protein ParE